MGAVQDPLIYKGVVFNEMKGVYSQPDSMNGTITQQALFPANSYAVDSGGNPAIIPDLTFEEFQARRCHAQSCSGLPVAAAGLRTRRRRLGARGTWRRGS